MMPDAAPVTNPIRGSGTAEFKGRLRIDPRLAHQPQKWSLIDTENLTCVFSDTFGVEMQDGTPFERREDGVYAYGNWVFDPAAGVLEKKATALILLIR